MSARFRDLFDQIGVGGLGVHTAVTAAGSGDATAINGLAIDRLGLGDRYQSLVAVIFGRVTMASGNSMKVDAKVQDSANNSDWTDYGAAMTTAVFTAAGGAFAAKEWYAKCGVDLSHARRYVRAVVTPDMAAAGTDTMTVEFACALAGASVEPTANPG